MIQNQTRQDTKDLSTAGFFDSRNKGEEKETAAEEKKEDVTELKPALLKLIGTYKVYEWNIEMIHRQNRGPNNDNIHKRCDEAYRYAQDSTDELAERLVMGLDGEIPTVMCDVIGLSCIQFMKALPENAVEYLICLEAELIEFLKKVEDLAEDVGDQNTMNTINGYVERHEKHQGFIKMMQPKSLSIKPINEGQTTNPESSEGHEKG